MEETTEQRIAKAQIEMFKIFKLTVCSMVALMTINALIGWSYGKDYVERNDYDQDRRESVEERNSMNAKIDKILNSVRNTEKDIAVINERLKGGK